MKKNSTKFARRWQILCLTAALGRARHFQYREARSRLPGIFQNAMVSINAYVLLREHRPARTFELWATYSLEIPFSIGPSCDMKSNPVPAVIAVVDDDESVRIATASLLRSCGWTVRIYASGIDLLSEIDRGDIRLVVADVQMPVMDGFALFERLGLLAKTIPVLFITAYATPDMVDKIVNSGAAGFFSKPLDDVRFLEKVTDIVNIQCR